MTEDIQILLDFFRNFVKVSEEEAQFLQELTFIKTFKKKELIQRQGEVVRYLAFVLSGAVRFFYLDDEGNEHTTEFAFENVPIGTYTGIASKAESIGNAETIEPTKLLIITGDNVLLFLEKFPKYFQVLSEVMGEALMVNNSRDKLLRISSSRERYEELCKTNPQVILRVPLTHIASYLQMALGTLSRVRAGKL